MRIAVLRQGQDPTALDRRIGMARQHALLFAKRAPNLPMTRLVERFGLSAIEEELLWFIASRHPVLAARDESPADAPSPPLSATLAAEALGDTARGRFEVQLALASEGNLIRLGLVRIEPWARGTVAPGDRRDQLRVPGFLPWYLAGRRVLSDDLVAFGARVPPSLGLEHVALQADLLERLQFIAKVLEPAAQLATDTRAGRFGYDFQQAAFVVVSGPRGSGKTLLSKALAGAARRHAIVLDGGLIGSLNAFEQQEVLLTAATEALVSGEVLIIDRADACFYEHPPDSHLEQRTAHIQLEALLQRTPIAVIATADSGGRLASSLRDKAFFTIDLPPLSREGANLVWQFNLPAQSVLGDGLEVDDVSRRFTLSGRGIQGALNIATRIDGAVLRRQTLELAAEAQQSSGMSDSTTRVWIRRPRADLELPDLLAQQIDEIITTERVRERTLETWGLAKKLHKGLGLVCLFDGDPGTGKTLAAEVVASELTLPLYSVNVANVVSKWIGETEKNLQRVFDDASRNRCVLLFDEADSLFGRRTSVNNSIDRFANMEINLLLQLVENYRGLVLLTTNLKDAIDPAFARRFAYKLSFELPDERVREKIWRRLLPKGHLAPDVRPAWLASAYERAGGPIRNVVLRAAYRAAATQRIVDQALLDECATHECRALGKLVRTR